MLVNYVMYLDDLQYEPPVYFSVESPGVKLFFESNVVACMGESVFRESQSESIKTVCTPPATENQTAHTRT